jgi:chromosome segregation ATPase
MDKHAEIKDKCDGLETRLDEIAFDIRDLQFDYKLVEKYTGIDEQLHEIQKWYEAMKDFIKRYTAEKSVIEKRLEDLDTKSKLLNNEVQNIRLQEFSRARHGGSYSQLQNIQHL